jgi:hypothetical protein
MSSLSKAAHTAPREYVSNGEAYSGADIVALADRVNAHVSTLAPVVDLPIPQWNEIVGDIHEATQLLFAIAAAKGGAA